MRLETILAAVTHTISEDHLSAISERNGIDARPQSPVTASSMIASVPGELLAADTDVTVVTLATLQTNATWYVDPSCEIPNLALSVARVNSYTALLSRLRCVCTDIIEPG